MKNSRSTPMRTIGTIAFSSDSADEPGARTARIRRDEELPPERLSEESTASLDVTSSKEVAGPQKGRLPLPPIICRIEKSPKYPSAAKSLITSAFARLRQKISARFRRRPATRAKGGEGPCTRDVQEHQEQEAQATGPDKSGPEK